MNPKEAFQHFKMLYPKTTKISNESSQNFFCVRRWEYDQYQDYPGVVVDWNGRQEYGGNEKCIICNMLLEGTPYGPNGAGSVRFSFGYNSNKFDTFDFFGFICDDCAEPLTHKMIEDYHI